MQSEYTTELVAEICQLAKGPARPVLEEAAREWLEGFKQALAKSRLEGDLPRTRLDRKWYQQLDKLHSKSLLPWPLTEGDLILDSGLQKGFTVLAVVHDVSCSFCLRLFPTRSVKDLRRTSSRGYNSSCDIWSYGDSADVSFGHCGLKS